MRKKIYGAIILTLVTGCSSLEPGMNISSAESQTVDGIKIINITPALLADNVLNKKASKDSIVPDVRLHPVDYLVGPHDILSIIVWDHPELNNPLGSSQSNNVFSNQTPLPNAPLSGTANSQQIGFMVDNRGNVFYPYIGEIYVANHSIPEIRRLITTKLAKYVKQPVVNVSVLNYRSQYVNVIGEVNKPAQIPMTDAPLTVMDAIAQAGGPNPNGDLKNITIHQDREVFRLNVNPSQVSPRSINIYLHNHDVIRVANYTENRVYVLGEVLLPQALPINGDTLSLSEALAVVGGVDPVAANADSVFVFRNNDQGQKVAYRLDASSPTALLLGNHFPLEPQDIVYVGTYKLTSWNRIASQLLPTSAILSNAATAYNRIKPIS